MIEAIYLDEGELISAGADGYVRVWDFETIDSADIMDENVTFEMEPLTEIKVTIHTHPVIMIDFTQYSIRLGMM